MLHLCSTKNGTKGAAFLCHIGRIFQRHQRMPWLVSLSASSRLTKTQAGSDMSFPLGPPPNTPPGSVVLTVSTQSARETYVAVPPAHVEDIFESFAGGRPFFITSTINPSTGK